MGNPDTKAAFKERAGHWADKLDVNVVWLGVRPMQKKWASCSTGGHLNFTTDLLDLKLRDLVRHAVFGTGVVLSCIKTRGDCEITVDFDNIGIKRLLLSLAPVEKID